MDANLSAACGQLKGMWEWGYSAHSSRPGCPLRVMEPPALPLGSQGKDVEAPHGAVLAGGGERGPQGRLRGSRLGASPALLWYSRQELWENAKPSLPLPN